jgi:hypothetical protein
MAAVSLIISNCKTPAVVSASTSFYQNANCSYSGGIVGDGSGTITISNSLNTATISLIPPPPIAINSPAVFLFGGIIETARRLL